MERVRHAASRRSSEIKQELVDAIRMLERAEYIDHNGHCSVRRDANSFYINSGASMRASLTVEDIVAVDLDGRPVDGGNVKPPLEFPIHAEVYRARPKVNAVFHTHPQWSTYLDHDRRAAEGGLCAGLAARRHAGDGLADVGQHPRDGREDGRHHGRQSRW